MEEALLDPRRLGIPRAYGVGSERRQAFLGASVTGRILVVVTVRRGGRWRVVTAIEADSQEKRRYRRGGK